MSKKTSPLCRSTRGTSLLLSLVLASATSAELVGAENQEADSPKRAGPVIELHPRDGLVLESTVGTPPDPNEKPKWVADEVLFKLKDPIAAENLSQGQLTESRALKKEMFMDRHHLTAAHLSPSGERPMRHRGFYRAALPSGKPMEASLQELRSDPDVEWAAPNYLYYTQATQPNDPRYGRQYHARYVGLESAWDSHTGSADVVVAIIDTGVHYNHRDLNDNIWTNPGEIPNDGIDNDGNGFIDDQMGWDFVSASASDVASGEDPGPRDNDPMDFHGHGTHVAGIVGAEGNNGTGVTGVAWDVSLMVVRAGYKNTRNQGVLADADIADALYYACDNGAHIVNMSFGGSLPSLLHRTVTSYCVEKGVLLVAAAGNSWSNTRFYPAAYDEVFAVAASDRMNDKAFFSSYGIWIDVTAPGDNIWSTLATGGYGVMSGTSMAAPIVCGVAALLKSARPEMTAEELALHLRASARDLNATAADFFTGLGAGLVQADLVTDTADLPPHLGVVSIASEWHNRSEGTIDLRPTVRNFSAKEEVVSIDLSTNDAYLSVIDGTADSGVVTSNQLMSASDSFQLQLIPGTPDTHLAEFTLSISTDGGLISSSEFKIPLSAIFQTSFWVADAADPVVYGKPRLAEHPDGSVSLVYYTFNASPNNQIYHRIRFPDGSWSDAQSLPNAPGESQAFHTVLATDDGNLHTSYVQVEENRGTFSWELYYALYDPQSMTWAATPLTQSANLFGTIFGHVTCLFEDADKQVNIMYPSLRNGRNGIFQIRQEDGVWRAPERVLEQDYDRPIFDFHCFTDSNQQPIALWREGLEMYYAQSIDGSWSLASLITTGKTGSKFGAGKDSAGNIHIGFLANGTSRMTHMAFDGQVWSTATRTFPKYRSNLYKFIMNSEDQPEVYTHYPTPSEKLHHQVFDGQAWEAQSWVFSIDTLSLDDDVLKTGRGETLLAQSYYFSPGSPGAINLISSRPYVEWQPSPPSVTAGRSVANDQIVARFSSDQNEGIAGYRVALGSAPGLDDVQAWTTALVNDTKYTFQFDALNALTVGRTYFVGVRALGNNGYWSSIGSSNGVGAKDQVLTVAVDIRPGSDANPIGRLGQGSLPVAILGSDIFDVSEVDPTTLAFGPDAAAPRHDLSKPGVFDDHLHDVNDDGITDLLSHFRSEDTGIEANDKEGCITGEMNDGTPFEGCDGIRTIRGGRRAQR